MPLDFPSIVPTSSSWEIVSNARQFVSPLTGAIQTAQRGGTRWRATLTFQNLSGAERAVMQAFLAKVQGTAANFYLYDHGFVRRGDAVGSPKVRGASQTGNSLDTYNWTGGDENSSSVRAGDYFEVNGELKMATADAFIIGPINESTLSFVPELRSSPVDDSAITFIQPKGIFRLASPVSGWSTSPGLFSTFTIEAIEDVIA
jgi:hypothetical protein